MEGPKNGGSLIWGLPFWGAPLWGPHYEGPSGSPHRGVHYGGLKGHSGDTLGLSDTHLGLQGALDRPGALGVHELMRKQNIVFADQCFLYNINQPVTTKSLAALPTRYKCSPVLWGGGWGGVQEAPSVPVTFRCVPVMFRCVPIMFLCVPVMFRYVPVMFRYVPVMFRCVSVMFRDVPVRPRHVPGRPRHVPVRSRANSPLNIFSAL